jgi:hypothetical protein
MSYRVVRVARVVDSDAAVSKKVATLSARMFSMNDTQITLRTRALIVVDRRVIHSRTADSNLTSEEDCFASSRPQSASTLSGELSNWCDKNKVTR